jgi:phosphohistidine phosphatase SixA
MRCSRWVGSTGAACRSAWSPRAVWVGWLASKVVGSYTSVVKTRHIEIDRRIVLSAGLAALIGVPTRVRADEGELVRALRHGGVALLMRHAQTTPGVGDPPGWKLEQCASQRNLDDSGIAHATRIGRWFAERRLRPTAVRHSPWCRTRDTARLAFGRSEPWAALSNIFEDRSGADAQAIEVRRFVDTLKADDLVVLVSHGSTINHVVGVGTAPGEAVVVRRRQGAPDAAAVGAGSIEVLGRLRVP